MRKTLLGLLLAALPASASADFCATCIQNSAAPQDAQINIGTATIRGTLTVNQLVAAAMNLGSVVAGTFTGDGSHLTVLNASAISSGTLPSARLAGPYTGITSVGALSAGTWQGTPVGTQYGGTGQNFVSVSTGSLLYFSGNGVMATLLPGPPEALLQTNGSAAPVWTSSPAVNGSNIFGINLSALSAGTLPTNIIVTTNSIPLVNGTSVVGDISGAAGSYTGPVQLSQLAAGILPNSVTASSITGTGISLGTYGDSSHALQIRYGTDGRASTITVLPLSVPLAQLQNGTLPAGVTVPAASINAGALNGSVIASSLTATGVTPGTYGSAVASPQLTIGSDGRITSATSFAIPLSSGSGGQSQTTFLLPVTVVNTSFTFTGSNGVIAAVSSITASALFANDLRISGSANVTSTATIGGALNVNGGGGVQLNANDLRMNGGAVRTNILTSFFGSTINVDGVASTGVNFNMLHNSTVTTHYVTADNMNAVSSITASTYFGDGSHLTGISSGVCQAGSGTASVLCSGSGNTSSAGNSVVSGGFNNNVAQEFGFIGSGANNSVQGSLSTACAVVAGESNSASGQSNFIGAGNGNNIPELDGSSFNLRQAAIVGGSSNGVTESWSFIGGGVSNAVNGQTGAVVGGQQNVASGFRSFVGGGLQNLASGSHSVVAGGEANQATGDHSFVGGGGGGGGLANAAESQFGTVTGGDSNVMDAGSTGGFIGGGHGNAMGNGYRSFIGGGAANSITGAQHAAIAGGFGNSILADQSFTGGGLGNTINLEGVNSVIPGGTNNTVNAPLSFAGGSGATTNFPGSFVWSSSSTNPSNRNLCVDGATNSFNVCSPGGIFLSSGPVIASSSMTALTYFGDGSHLTGISSSSFNGGTVSNQTTFLSTVTIKGSAFSVGGSSFVVSGGSATVAYGLTAARITATDTGSSIVASGQVNATSFAGTAPQFLGNNSVDIGVTGTGNTSFYSQGVGSTPAELVLNGVTRNASFAYGISGGSLTISGQGQVGSTFTVQGSAFSVGGSSFVVSGGSTTVAYSMTAKTYFGDGSQLTGISGGGGGNQNTFRSSVTVVNSSFTFSGPNGYITSASSINAGAFFGNGFGITGVVDKFFTQGAGTGNLYTSLDGASNNVSAGFFNGIFAGQSNLIDATNTDNAILGGLSGNITSTSDRCVILGGDGNTITNVDGGAIISGSGSSIGPNANHSLVVGVNGSVVDANSFVFADGTNPYSDHAAASFNVLATGGVFIDAAGASVNIDSATLNVYGLVTSSTPIPSVSCNVGTGVIRPNSGTMSGEFLAGTGATNCTVTFATSWSQKPSCWCNDQSAGIVVNATMTSGSVTCSSLSALTGTTVNYGCLGVP